MNSDKENREYLGALGEKLVAKLEEAILSENKYDTEKDMVDKNGKFIEVKTQNRNTYNNYFSVNANKLINLHKCLTVDRLIFVEYDETDIIKVWECTQNKTSGLYYKTTNTIMFGWPINKMKLIHTVCDKELSADMRKHSRSSIYKK